MPDPADDAVQPAAAAGPRGSVVIPAWNEASVISRTLHALYDGVDPAAFETVVACNGCTDTTAQVAERTGLPVQVLDLPPVGKVGAIRAAERALTALPRLYLDADTVLPGDSALAVLDALASGAVAARPPLRYDTAGSSWPVRRFYRVREGLPSVMGDLCGAGVYGLSATARARFDEFPSFSGDDLFAARIVTADEVVIVDAPPVVVHVPRDVRSLVRILGRGYRGNRELATAMPVHAASTAGRTASELRDLARSPRRWLDAAVYTAIVIAGRLASRRGSDAWHRDDSAREAATGARA